MFNDQKRKKNQTDICVNNEAVDKWQQQRQRTTVNGHRLKEHLLQLGSNGKNLDRVGNFSPDRNNISDNINGQRSKDHPTKRHKAKEHFILIFRNFSFPLFTTFCI